MTPVAHRRLRCCSTGKDRSLMGDSDHGDEPPFPAMAPEGVEELSEEQQDKQAALKQEASDAAEDGKLEQALEKLTEAIKLGNVSALMYSRRAQFLMQLGRPRAVVNDCTAALTINPDSGKAYKVRARANLKLERWEAAHSDFQTGLKIDYDDQTDEDSREVAAKVKEMKAAEVGARVAAEEAAQAAKVQAAKEKREAAQKAYEESKKDEESKSYSGPTVEEIDEDDEPGPKVTPMDEGPGVVLREDDEVD